MNNPKFLNYSDRELRALIATYRSEQHADLAEAIEELDLRVNRS